MLMVTHAAVAGAVGQHIESPYLAFLMGMIIHLAMDKIPHTWPVKKYTQNIFKFSDVFLTTAFIIFLFFVKSPNPLGLIWGALGGIIIDVTLVGIMREKGKLAAWHTKRQPHKESLKWLATDVAIFIFGLLLIIMFK